MNQPSLLSADMYISRKVKSLPVREQPAFRVYNSSDTCNLVELLAVIIGGGDQLEVAEQLVQRFGTIKRLAIAHPEELTQVRGMGMQTALRLKAALALGRRLLEPEEERPSIQSPSDAAALLIPRLVHLPQEHLVTLVLDTRNRVLDLSEVYHGSLNSAAVRVGEVFRSAIQQNAAAIIAAHNHPSGAPRSI